MYLTLLILSVVIFAGVCVYFIKSPAATWFHPLTFYIGFHGMVFVLRPLVAWYYEFDHIYMLYGFVPSHETKAMSIVVANLGFLVFAAASLSLGNEPFRVNRSAFAEQERTALIRPFLAMCIALAPFMIYSFYIIWSDKLSGEKSMIMDLSKGVAINVDSNGYIKSVQLAAVSITPIFAWLFRFKLWAFIPMLMFVFFRAGTGGRGPIVMSFACLACLYLYDKRKRWLDWRIIVAAAMTVMVFNALGEDRGRAVRDLVAEDTSASTKVRYTDRTELAPMEGMDLGNLEYLEYLVEVVPAKTGTHEYFLDQLQIFTEPIPRVLWKDKPIGQPIALFNLFDYGSPIGMTRSLPGEGWMQLGLIGVVFWCGLWGALLGLLYNAFVFSRQTILQTAAYCSTLPMMIIFYRDGSPITLLKGGLFIVVPVGLWYILSRIMGTLREEDFRLMAIARQLRHAGRKGRRDHAQPAEPGLALSGHEPDRTPAPDGPVPRSRRKSAADAMVPRAWRKAGPLANR